MATKRTATISAFLIFVLVVIGSGLGLIKHLASQPEPIPVLEFSATIPPLATETQERPLEAAGTVEGIYSIVDPDFGRLVTFQGFTFQCEKVKGSEYINFYQFGILYMGPIEYSKQEWENLTNGQKEAIKAECNL